MGEARLKETADAVDTPGPDVATPDLNVNPEDDAEDRASGRAGSRPITAADIPAEDPEAVSDGGAAAAAVDADQVAVDSAGDAAGGGEPEKTGRRRPRLVQIGALLIVACLALLPIVAGMTYQALTRNGSTFGVVGAVLWLGARAVAAVTIDRGLTRN